MEQNKLIFHTNIGFTFLDRIKIFFGYKMTVSVVLEAKTEIPEITKHSTYFNLYSNKEMYEKSEDNNSVTN